MQFQPERCCRLLIKHKFVFGLLVERIVARFCAPLHLTCHLRNTTHRVRKIDAISHEATDLDKLTIRINCRDTKSGGEISDQLPVGQEAGFPTVGLEQ